MWNELTGHWTRLHYIIAGLCVMFPVTVCCLLWMLHNALESADKAWAECNRWRNRCLESESHVRCLGTYLNAKP